MCTIVLLKLASSSLLQGIVEEAEVGWTFLLPLSPCNCKVQTFGFHPRTGAYPTTSSIPHPCISQLLLPYAGLFCGGVLSRLPQSSSFARAPILQRVCYAVAHSLAHRRRGSGGVFEVAVVQLYAHTVPSFLSCAESMNKMARKPRKTRLDYAFNWVRKE